MIQTPSKPGSIHLEWPLGSFIYHRANADRKGIIKAFTIYAGSDEACYVVSWGDGETGEHLAIELTDEKPVEFSENSDGN